MWNHCVARNELQSGIVPGTSDVSPSENFFIQIIVFWYYTPDVSEICAASIFRMTEIFQVADEVTVRKKFVDYRPTGRLQGL